jgi:GT2 family glycosyltransferase
VIFSSKSNVTLVITSCNRFDLLKKTLESFSKKNTYPIKEIIIIEDSGNLEIRNIIPDQWIDHIKLIINEKNLGQIKSIDLAYKEVTTDYIFHCEDDWLFYRNGFIEDSMKILESDKSILTVWLRDIEKDIEKNYPFHYVFDEKTIDKISFYQLGSENPDWRGFTFNPTLKRKSDYKKLIKYERYNMTAIKTESFLSNFYDAIGMHVVILKESAVEHIGWNDHVFTLEEKYKKINEEKYKKYKKYKHILLGFILGIIICSLAVNKF